MLGKRVLLLAAAIVLASAGCLNRGPSEASANATTSTPPTGPPVVVNGFTIVGPTITAASEDRPPREDDPIRVNYTVRNDRAEAFSRFVTYLENGEVADTSNIRLEPGASRSFEKLLPATFKKATLRVEVRAGDQRANATAEILPWPRTGDTVDLGPVQLRVERWLQDPTTKEVLANVTLTQKALPAGEYRMLRGHLLCATPSGNLTAVGEARPEPPGPENTTLGDLRFPDCPDIIYGVDFTGLGPKETPLYARILFVEAGWRPPQS